MLMILVYEFKTQLSEHFLPWRIQNFLAIGTLKLLLGELRPDLLLERYIRIASGSRSPLKLRVELSIAAESAAFIRSPVYIINMPKNNITTGSRNVPKARKILNIRYQSAFNFLGLPRELRDIVYHHALVLPSLWYRAHNSACSISDPTCGTAPPVFKTTVSGYGILGISNQLVSQDQVD